LEIHPFLSISFYDSIFFFVIYFGKILANYYEIYPKINEIAPLMSSNPDEFSLKFQEILLSENFKSFSMMIVVVAIIYPMNIGFFKIYNQIDAQKKLI
jgi:hypothetical protein